MAARPKTRIVAAPPSQLRELGPGASMRLVGGSMGAPDPNVPIATISAATVAALSVDERTEAPAVADDAWEAEVRRREMAQGMPPEPASSPHAAANADIQFHDGHLNASVLRALHVKPSSVPIAYTPFDDLILPNTFTLHVERKGDRWKVTAPGVHFGLFIADADIRAALAGAPEKMAEILHLDGPSPVQKRNKASGERKRTGG